MKRFVLGGLIATCLLAVFVSPFASNLPDGLERVAADKGFLHRAERKHAVKAVVPGYAMPGIRNGKVATGVAGLAGTLLVFGLTYGLSLILKGARSDVQR